MSLKKIGTQLKILASGPVLEDVMVEHEKPTQKVVEQKRNDFLYFRSRAISAGDQGPEQGKPNPNGNGDYFPKSELESSYQTFVGRNLFLNHESDHPVKSIGKIIDAYPVEDEETGEFYIECLSKIDKKLHPEIARKVETGELNTVSMGCSCESSQCSICGMTIHTDEDQKCQHLSPGGLLREYVAETDLPEYGIKNGDMTKSFAINKGLTFNELSIVNVPADSRAVIKTVIANLRNQLSKTASLSKEEQLQLVGQFDEVLKQLDDKTREQVKAEFCACSIVKGEKMSDQAPKSINEEVEVERILHDLNAYDYLRLYNSIEKKMKKEIKADNKIMTHCDECNKTFYDSPEGEGKCPDCKFKVVPKIEEVKAELPKEVKEEIPQDMGYLDKIIERAKKSFAAKLFTQTVKRVAEEETVKKELPAGPDPILEEVKCEECGKMQSKCICASMKEATQTKEAITFVEKGDKVKNTETGEKGTVIKTPGEDEVVRIKTEDGKYKTLPNEENNPEEHKKWKKIKAEFKKNEDLSKSSWVILDGDKTILQASLGQIWEDELTENQEWAMSEDYGNELVSRYQVDGVEKLSALLGIAYQKTEVKTDYKIDKPKKNEFVKPGEETKADKEHKKTEEALEKVDQTEVATHLEDSKPESVVKEEKKEEKKAAQEVPNFTQTIAEEEAAKKEKIETPKEEMPKVEPKTEMPKEEELKKEESAFDKGVDKIVLNKGHYAVKDKETKEICVYNEKGEEIKRLPDGFGDEVVTVMKLLNDIMGLKEEEEEPKIEEPIVEPKVEELPEDEPKLEEPEMETPKEEIKFNLENASKKDELTKKAEELTKKEAELKEKEAKLYADKFAMSINSRVERCKPIIEAMMERDMISFSEEDLGNALDTGVALLDARTVALQKAVNRQLQALLALDDSALKTFVDSVKNVKKLASTKKLSRPLYVEFEVKGFDDEISDIFSSMGTLKNKK